MWNINYFDVLDSDGGPTRLLISPAQYRSTPGDPLDGTWRTFDSLDLRLFYSNHIETTQGGSTPALSDAPTLSSIQAASNGNAIEFQMRVIGNPAAGIQQVWVTYTGTSGELQGKWESLDLKQSSQDSTLWTGTLNTSTPPSDVRYIVQAVNGVGLVTFAANLGAFYTPDVNPGANPGTTATQIELLDPPGSAAFGTEVTLSAQLTSNNQPVQGQTVTIGLGAQRVQAITNSNGRASATLNLSASPGDYSLQASFNGDGTLKPSSASGSFTIGKQATQLSLDLASKSPQYSDESGLSATVHDALDGALGQVSIAFVFSGENGSFSSTAITDLVSRAALGPANLPAGTYNVTASFGEVVTLSDGTLVDLTDPRYTGSNATRTIKIAAEDATVAYTGDDVVKADKALHLAAKVEQDQDGALGDITLAQVRFNVVDDQKKIIASETAQVAEDGSVTALLKDLPRGEYKLAVQVVGGYFRSPAVNVPLTVEGGARALSRKIVLTDTNAKAFDALELKFKKEKGGKDYRITGTVPGLFIYSEMIENKGTVRQGVSLTIHVPDGNDPPVSPAFCLKGPNAVHVYADAERTNEVTAENEITPRQPLSDLDAKSRKCVSNITANISIPAGESRVVTLVFEYAGKSASGFDKAAIKNHVEGFKFSDTLAATGLADIHSIITLPAVGKNATGIGGFALDQDLNPRSELTVRVLDGDKVIGRGKTDGDGFYAILVPPGGPYRVELRDDNQLIDSAKVNQLKPKKFVKVDFREAKEKKAKENSGLLPTGATLAEVALHQWRHDELTRFEQYAAMLR